MDVCGDDPGWRNTPCRVEVELPSSSLDQGPSTPLARPAVPGAGGVDDRLKAAGSEDLTSSQGGSGPDSVADRLSSLPTEDRDAAHGPTVLSLPQPPVASDVPSLLGTGGVSGEDSSLELAESLRRAVQGLVGDSRAVRAAMAKAAPARQPQLLEDIDEPKVCLLLLAQGKNTATDLESPRRTDVSPRSFTPASSWVLPAP